MVVVVVVRVVLTDGGDSENCQVGNVCLSRVQTW